jgi:hypothetical protein
MSLMSFGEKVKIDCSLILFHRVVLISHVSHTKQQFTLFSLFCNLWLLNSLPAVGYSQSTQQLLRGATERRSLEAIELIRRGRPVICCLFQYTSSNGSLSSLTVSGRDNTCQSGFRRCVAEANSDGRTSSWNHQQRSDMNDGYTIYIM